jgi:hypothetical protein
MQGPAIAVQIGMTNKLMDMNRENYLRSHEHKPTDDEVLQECERMIREGNRRNAYELSLKATESAPQNVQAWWLRATLAPSLDDRVMSVNRVNELDPDYQDRHHLSFFTVREALDRDPFLAYYGETDDLYRAVNAQQVVMSIPKQRVPAENFLLKQTSPLRAAYRWLVLAFLGLLVAGLGTILFAPLAALSARQARSALRSHSERVSSTVVITLSVLLLLLGLNFAFLFFIHWVG